MHRSTRIATKVGSQFSCLRSRSLRPVSRPIVVRQNLAAQNIPFKRQFHARGRMAAATDSIAAQNAAELDITPDSLSKTLQEKIGATHCVIEDMSGGCGQAFEAIIVSPQFEKKNSLARHRLVNGALKQEIAAIHAWTPKCFTPEEWEKKQAA